MCGLYTMEENHTDELTWKVCPATLHPWKGVCAWCMILGAGAVITPTNLILGIASFLFLIFALAPVIFTSTFTIDREGIRAKHHLQEKHYQWEQIRRARFLKDACALFNTRKQSFFMGPGMQVLYGMKKDEISAAIKAKLHEGVSL